MFNCFCVKYLVIMCAGSQACLVVVDSQQLLLICVPPVLTVMVKKYRSYTLGTDATQHHVGRA